MDNQFTLENFLQDTYAADPVKHRINIFNKVMNYPYQINGARTIEKLIEQQCGYCVPKARLLQDAYVKLGYKTKLCFVPFAFDMLALPEEFRDWGFASKKGYHTFIQLLVDDNRIDLDATFHPALKEWFQVNENWDGVSSQKVIYPYNEVYVPQTQDEEYEVKNKLNDPAGRNTKDDEWIEKFNKWIIVQTEKINKDDVWV